MQCARDGEPSRVPITALLEGFAVHTGGMVVFALLYWWGLVRHPDLANQFLDLAGLARNVVLPRWNARQGGWITSRLLLLPRVFVLSFLLNLLAFPFLILGHILFIVGGRSIPTGLR